MDFLSVGIPVLHSRVESWECDYNGHWNTRFYGRAFSAAAEVIQQQSEIWSFNPPFTRHIRFHRELFSSATVAVRSGRFTTSVDQEAVTHFLLSDRQISATALDYVTDAPGLPSLSEQEVALALPRGIDPANQARWLQMSSTGIETLLGPVMPADVDHRGDLHFERLLSYGSIASNHQMEMSGFTPEYADQQKINRMAVELRVCSYHSPTVGTCLRSVSHMIQSSPKSLNAHHRIETLNGALVATQEYCLLMVSNETRRAVPVPALFAGLDSFDLDY